jgi:hypothetical protein
VWVTTYALTQGIQKVDRVYLSHDMVYWHPGGVACPAVYAHGEGTNWHQNEEGARSRVAQMIAAKLKRLELQRARLEDLLKNGPVVTTLTTADR